MSFRQAASSSQQVVVNMIENNERRQLKYWVLADFRFTRPKRQTVQSFCLAASLLKRGRVPVLASLPLCFDVCSQMNLSVNPTNVLFPMSTRGR